MPVITNDYLIFVRPEPAEGAVMREVVRVARAVDYLHDNPTVDPTPGTTLLEGVGLVQIYDSMSLALDAEFCEELAGLWAQALDYNRTGGAGEGYSEFLRRFGTANDRVDRHVHDFLTSSLDTLAMVDLP
jgi:hypothetical protein